MSEEQTSKRVQRKRSRGWKMPPNTVYVGRPSKWGNPFKIDSSQTRDEAIILYRNYLRAMAPEYLHDKILLPLKGKDLACWCAISEKCHADILLQYLEEKRS